MAAILRRQPLTIKQQVEELKNWRKQQQSKLDPQTSAEENCTNKNIKIDENTANLTCGPNSVSKTNFDEIPIRVTNSSFSALVENNVASVDSIVKTVRPVEKDNKPKFRFLKKGEGIARFNMRPPRIVKKSSSRRQDLALKLIKDPIQSDNVLHKQKAVNESTNLNFGKVEETTTLRAPDVKLNFTWKSILSGENPEDMLEKAISNNQLELFDPNTSIDSSTASLMEKLLAIGKNKLSRDRDELQVFEAIEQHMLDSSFCSTSSYVTKLMENAVISTPNKDGYNHHQQSEILAPTSRHNDEVPTKLVQDGGEVNSRPGVVLHNMFNPSVNSSEVGNKEKAIKTNTAENKLEGNQINNENNYENKKLQPMASWAKQETIRNHDHDTTDSTDDLEQSMHVRFADQVDYKSFVDNSQSVDSESQKEGNGSSEFDESQEWKEDSDDSSSCCSQCTRHDSSTEGGSPQVKLLQPNQSHSQSENRIPLEKQHAVALNTIEKLNFNNDSNNFPPMVIEKLKELEEEIKIFREENTNIKSLREKLDKEHRQIQEERRQLNLEKRKLKKEIEEEQMKLTSQIEEERQKLVKEKSIFEKYSKTLTNKPSREERKEIQALKEQLAEIKEELNKKESRWGAAQARVRNQVKVLEEDNKKLREEIEKFRKQAKYWELFNQKKKGGKNNNTRLIHAISEHISNIVLDDESSQAKYLENTRYVNQNISCPQTSTITQSDIKNMYGVKVINENKNSSTLSGSNKTSKSIFNEQDFPPRKSVSSIGTDNMTVVNDSDLPLAMANFSVEPKTTSTQSNPQTEDRCRKPSVEEESSNVIKEAVDESGNVEIVFPDGNIKKINKITGREKYIYVNGDVEEITHDGTVKYYYSKSRIWQTTLPDGLEIIDFPDGKVEKRHVDGTIEIIYSNNNKKFNYPDGSQEIIYIDGTRLKTEADKTHVLTLPNGQKEIHTEEWKRREYPDGTMKTLYPDGTTETVYSNGRVRLKDKFGNLIMDSGSLPKP